MGVIRKRKVSWLGYTLRGISEGKMERKRRKLEMFENIKHGKIYNHMKDDGARSKRTDSVRLYSVMSSAGFTIRSIRKLGHRGRKPQLLFSNRSIFIKVEAL